MLYKIVAFILKILYFFLFDLKIHNAEALNDTEGRYIVCGNHISVIDPVTLSISTKRQIHYMGKKELFKNKFINYIFRKLGAFPVDREGMSLSAIKSSLEVLNNEEVLGIFPEGTRVFTGYNEDNAKPGIALIAAKGKSKILPFYIEGPYKFRGKIHIYFGEGKDYFENYTGKYNTEKYTEVGKEILKDIYKLGRNE